MRNILLLVFTLLVACNNQQSTVAGSAAGNKKAQSTEKSTAKTINSENTSTEDLIKRQDNIDSVEALGYQVLYSLKNSNYNEYDRLLVPKDEFLDYYRQLGDFDEEQAKDQALVDNAYTLFKSLGLSNFERMSNQVKVANINWKAIEVTNNSVNGKIMKLIFSDGQNKYTFTGNSFGKLNGRLYLGNTCSFEKK